MTGRRIVSINFPHFAIERWERMMERNGNAPADDMPMVLTVEGTHGPVLWVFKPVHASST
jgi:protein ImuB